MSRLSPRIALATLLVPVLASAQRVHELHLQRTLRIDANAANLSPVTWLAVSRTGDMIVGQAQDHLVRFFDAAGHAQGTLGHEGEGPGEFRDLSRAGWMGDTLWVTDYMQHRFTLIGPNRTFVRNVSQVITIKAPSDTNSSAMVAGAVTLNPDGSQMINVIVPSDKAQRPSWAMDDQGTGSRGLLVNVSSSQSLQRVVSFYPHDDCGMVMVPGYQLCGHPNAGVEPAGNFVAWVKMGMGGADSGTYQITLYRKSGALMYSRRYPFVAQTVPAHIRDSMLAPASKARGPVVPPAMMPTISPPAIYAPVQSLAVASDGSVWVELRATADGIPWTILSPTGVVTGHLMAPCNSKLLVVSKDTAWGTEKDADDQESVVRYRIATTP